MKEKIKGFIDKLTAGKDRRTLMLILIIFIVLILALVSSSEVPSKVVPQQVLGNSDKGIVIKEGPYGNVSSPVKIAYILGQHPRESRAHIGVGDAVKKNSKSFRYCYYLYYINVTNDTYDFWKGRQNGQNLSYEYVVPDIIQGNFSLAVDVHASNGRYINKPFVFVPKKDDVSLNVSRDLTISIKWLYYHQMPDYSSPFYTTIPLIQGGTPSLVFEAYAEPSSVMGQQCQEFVMRVDQLNF